MNKLLSSTPAFYSMVLAGFAATALTGAAHAQSHADSAIDPHWYLGAGVGHTNADPNKADYTDLRSGAATTNGRDNSTALKVYGGVQLTPRWGLELGYADLGRYQNTYSLPATGSYAQSTNKLSAWSLAGVGTWPVTGAFSLHAKAGLALVSSQYSFSGGGSYASGDNGSDLSANPMFGVGAKYDINRNFAIRFDYENYGKVGKSTGNLTTAGATGESRPSMVSASVQYNF